MMKATAIKRKASLSSLYCFAALLACEAQVCDYLQFGNEAYVYSFYIYDLSRRVKE